MLTGAPLYSLIEENKSDLNGILEEGQDHGILSQFCAVS